MAKKAASKKAVAKKSVAKKVAAKKAAAKTPVAKSTGAKKVAAKPVVPTAGPQAGDVAPDFSCPATPGGTVSLAQFKGQQNVVLYFYPRDNTPGCTTEACTFQEHLGSLSSAGTAVIGVSTDSLKSHEGFAAKFGLKFPLIADVDHTLAETYGVWVEKSMYGRTMMGLERSTFLINKQGQVAKVWRKVKVDGHVAEVKAAVAGL
jgi:thioredoxin-dependent peroxiredoxin